jgi:hypothetical protein
MKYIYLLSLLVVGSYGAPAADAGAADGTPWTVYPAPDSYYEEWNQTVPSHDLVSRQQSFDGAWVGGNYDHYCLQNANTAWVIAGQCVSVGQYITTTSLVAGRTQVGVGLCANIREAAAGWVSQQELSTTQLCLLVAILEVCIVYCD